jgi:glutamine synthetase
VIPQLNVYTLAASDRNADGIRRLVESNPNIRFVSLVGVDLGGNDTDERIPIATFLKDGQALLDGGVQTDGSSVVLPGIATLNDGKVDLVADPSVSWHIDYNYENIHAPTGLPVGTLKIPAFLLHNEQRVDSRAVLANAVDRAGAVILDLLRGSPPLASELGLGADDVDRMLFTIGTELEFWVRTPGGKAETEALAVSQALQEQYWKRTRGPVRTALEQALELLDAYGLQPEMGHKEVGGVEARVSGAGFSDVMEQIEIDWRYAEALQAADNELLARIVIRKAFRLNGLEVTFLAKPIEGVAGNGEHTHVGMAARLKDGSVRNLFTAANPRTDYLSSVGWGAIMGLLRNYPTIGPFVNCSSDAFNRLEPGFEAPVCTVAAVGHTVETPSRNRSVLAGLVRDIESPLATRFEFRAANPYTNSYLAVAAIYQGMVHGIGYAVSSGKSPSALQAEFSKKPGETATYLETARQYRSEDDVFEHFNREERDELFGVPPGTVYETLQALDGGTEALGTLVAGDVFPPRIVESYRQAMLLRWRLELLSRIIPDTLREVREMTPVHADGESVYDDDAWQRVNALRRAIARDSKKRPSLLSTLRRALEEERYAEASALQLDLKAKMRELRTSYAKYSANVL